MMQVDEKQIESWTKTAAFAAVLLYMCGYLVITIRNANFGFYAGDIVKPRMLAAGATFSLLCVIPTHLAHKMLVREKISGAISLAKAGLALVAYSVEIMSLIYLTSLFIHGEPIPSSPAHFLKRDAVRLVITLLAGGSLAYFYFVGKDHLDKHPKLVILLSALFLGITAWNQISDISAGTSALNLWLLSAGLIGCLIYRKGIRRDLSLGHLALITYIFLVAITFYADLVFPHIYQRWGGGHPIPVAVSLLDKATNKTSDLTNADLLDEDAGGFFVQYGSNEVAVFVPKDYVSRICYLERAQPRDVTGVLLPAFLVYLAPKKTTDGCAP